MEKVILTSDLSFARTICASSAIYFDPTNSKDIAEKIISLISSKEKQMEKIKNGLYQLKKFNSPKERAIKYLNICKDLVNAKKS